jgi:hypothetical protein
MWLNEHFHLLSYLVKVYRNWSLMKGRSVNHPCLGISRLPATKKLCKKRNELAFVHFSTYSVTNKARKTLRSFQDYLVSLRFFYSWVWADNPCSPTKTSFVCSIEDSSMLKLAKHKRQIMHARKRIKI